MFQRISSAGNYRVWLVLTFAAMQTWAQAADKPVVLTIGGHSINAEVVATPEGRERGLMFRENLAKNDGMLFVFDQVGYHGMWMKNTLIPLAVAFADEKGKILNIAEMLPHSEITHRAAGPARYALEMNAGWFKKRNLEPGATIIGIEKLSRGQ
jgi:uncharacterized membrane protein (UPF0127 family)